MGVIEPGHLHSSVALHRQKPVGNRVAASTIFRRALLLLTGIHLFFSTTWSQHDVQLSHYMFNQPSYNPAFAGIKNMITGSLLVRTQWTGFDQSPKTQVFNGDFRLPEDIGNAGISIINDRLGYEKSTNLRFIYANHKQITKSLIASAGIGVGLLSKSLDGSQLIYYDNSDPNAVYSLTRNTRPVVDIGVRITNHKWTAAISSTHVNRSNGGSTYFNTPRHVYLYGDYHYNEIDRLTIRPSLLVKSNLYKTTFDLTAYAMLDRKVQAGLSYRSGEALVILAGYQVSELLKINYAYDVTLGAIQPHSSGSHEILLVVTINKENPIPYYKTPRLFN